MITHLVLKESEFHHRDGVRRVKETHTGGDFYPRVTDRRVPPNVKIVPDFTFPAVERKGTPQGDRFSIRVFSPTAREGIPQGEYLSEDEAARDLPNFAIPMPGDAVRLTGRYPGIAEGAVAFIQGVVGRPEAEYSVAFFAQAFRGTGDCDYPPGSPIRVSCGGGPLVTVRASELAYTGEKRTAYFWHWRAHPAADGGQDYTLEVPLWNWAGLQD